MIDSILEKQFFHKLQEADYPCVMAKSALLAGNIHVITADAFCPDPRQAEKVLAEIYNAIDEIKKQTGRNHSIAVLFRSPSMISEDEYEAIFWPYLQCLHQLDSRHYAWDKRVSSDPASTQFSFSLKGEAFYVIGMHNTSSRKARLVDFPAIILNPHSQFEHLRKKGSYEKIRDSIRARDATYAGEENPMLENFGEESEVFQYTGRVLDKEKWTCPFKPHSETH